MSKIDPSLSYPLRPIFHPSATPESPKIQSLLSHLSLIPHTEGGYFCETDRDPLRIPNPFKSLPRPANATATLSPLEDATRSASTSIFYFLSPHNPRGVFHRNLARTVHTLHKGRGRYVLIHTPEDFRDQQGRKARIETFVVGHNVEKGERLQWIVEGGKYKASYLLPDHEGGEESEGLLISEVSESLS